MAYVNLSSNQKKSYSEIESNANLINDSHVTA